MAFDAYCYFPGSTIEGETTDSTMSAQKAFEIKNFDIGAENTTDIASATGGVAAGRASFKVFHLQKIPIQPLLLCLARSALARRLLIW
jgi:hypothetical protein